MAVFIYAGTVKSNWKSDGTDDCGDRSDEPGGCTSKEI